MASKRRRLISDSESDDEIDENIFLPDPDNSGNEDDSEDSESEFFDDIAPEKTYEFVHRNFDGFCFQFQKILQTLLVNRSLLIFWTIES